MKLSRVIFALPLALAMPAKHGFGNIDVSISLGNRGISTRDDDDYTTCLRVLYPPKHECPNGWV